MKFQINQMYVQPPVLSVRNKSFALSNILLFTCLLIAPTYGANSDTTAATAPATPTASQAAAPTVVPTVVPTQAATAPATPTAKPSTSPVTEQGTTPGATSVSKMEELTLEDMRDVGMALQLIRQDCINVYSESVRSRVALTDGPEIRQPDSIPIDTSHLQLLPARREYLVYYLASMEPAIRLLAHEMSDAQTGVKTWIIPETIKKNIDPLWESWQKLVAQLNKHLDMLVPLFDDAEHNNVQVSKVAVDMFNDVGVLEELRRSVYKIVQDTHKPGTTEKIMVQHDTTK